MWHKYYTGYVLMALSVIFAMWDDGAMSGKLLVAVAAFAFGFACLDLKDEVTNE